MLIRRCRGEQFRCFEQFDVELSPTYNLVSGQNASGKTSFLEALVFLGRGKSFRNAPVSTIVRHGQREFTLFAELGFDTPRATLGVRAGANGYEARGNPGGDIGQADAARMLPVSVVDPDVHELVAGGPERRRRYLDALAFHVEHGFVEEWRRFRRVLRQRNAALRGGGGPISVWDEEFEESAVRLDAARRRTVDALLPGLQSTCEGLLSESVAFDYSSGWPDGPGLGALLKASRERELKLGSTQYGPHRGDLRIRLDARQAKRLVSRGQQKLLSAAFLLASTALMQDKLGQPVLFLLDDPAAELDKGSLARLMSAVAGLQTQVVLTSLDREFAGLPDDMAMFHVEHGVMQQRPS